MLWPGEEGTVSVSMLTPWLGYSLLLLMGALECQSAFPPQRAHILGSWMPIYVYEFEFECQGARVCIHV